MANSNHGDDGAVAYSNDMLAVVLWMKDKQHGIIPLKNFAPSERGKIAVGEVLKAKFSPRYPGYFNAKILMIGDLHDDLSNAEEELYVKSMKETFGITVDITENNDDGDDDSASDSSEDEEPKKRLRGKKKKFVKKTVPQKNSTGKTNVLQLQKAKEVEHKKKMNKKAVSSEIRQALQISSEQIQDTSVAAGGESTEMMTAGIINETMLLVGGCNFDTACSAGNFENLRMDSNMQLLPTSSMTPQGITDDISDWPGTSFEDPQVDEQLIPTSHLTSHRITAALQTKLLDEEQTEAISSQQVQSMLETEAQLQMELPDEEQTGSTSQHVQNGCNNAEDLPNDVNTLKHLVQDLQQLVAKKNQEIETLTAELNGLTPPDGVLNYFNRLCHHWNKGNIKEQKKPEGTMIPIQSKELLVEGFGVWVTQTKKKNILFALRTGDAGQFLAKFLEEIYDPETLGKFSAKGQRKGSTALPKEELNALRYLIQQKYPTSELACMERQFITAINQKCASARRTMRNIRGETERDLRNKKFTPHNRTVRHGRKRKAATAQQTQAQQQI